MKVHGLHLHCSVLLLQTIWMGGVSSPRLHTEVSVRASTKEKAAQVDGKFCRGQYTRSAVSWVLPTLGYTGCWSCGAPRGGNEHTLTSASAV